MCTAKYVSHDKWQLALLQTQKHKLHIVTLGSYIHQNQDAEESRRLGCARLQLLFKQFHVSFNIIWKEIASVFEDQSLSVRARSNDEETRRQDLESQRSCVGCVYVYRILNRFAPTVLDKGVVTFRFTSQVVTVNLTRNVRLRMRKSERFNEIYYHTKLQHIPGSSCAGCTRKRRLCATPEPSARTTGSRRNNELPSTIRDGNTITLCAWDTKAILGNDNTRTNSKLSRPLLQRRQNS